jgi:serine phosphatase RsbU (regulator of sigma subunit)
VQVGGDWYDALPLPEGALGLAVGSVSGSGPSALAAMGRLRASLRAYAVMEGEDPVAVLSDLELLLRLTEPARTATALFAYAEPARRKIVLAGAGHTPPLVVGERRTEFVETSLSAPLGMLACWEAPSVELSPEPGETVLLYTDGLLRRTGDPMDRAFARLHAAAASVPKAVRHDPAAIADHVLRTVLPEGLDEADSGEDVVLLAARFD